MASDNRLFDDLVTCGNAIKMELCHVERLVFAMHHNLGGSAAHGRGLLQPMTGEAVEEEEVFNVHMWPQNRIMIEGVIGVVPRPFGLHFDRLELRNACGKDWPDVVFPDAVIHYEIIRIDGGIDV